MNKYRLVYSVSEGRYSMDISTGIIITACSLKSAKKKGDNIEKKFSANGEQEWISPSVQVGIQLKTLDITIDYKEECIPKLAGIEMTKPQVLTYEILQPQGEHEMLMGYPIWTQDDIVRISKANFIENILKDYEQYFIRKHCNTLVFEPIAYWVEEQPDKG